MARIDVVNLRKAFGDFTAVKDSTFTVNDGEFFCLLGPSGCGKTTTLRMIAGLELPTSGEIRLAGEEVTFKPASQRDIAFVFQLFALYPHMNVRQNISYPLKNIGMSRAQIEERLAEAARTLRIEHLLDRPVTGLSSGDRQRVALGRAIVREPAAFMMDEPLGALDAEFRHIMCGELRALHDRLKATTVYVTHDQLEAMSMGDKIAVMNQGIIEQFGSPQEIYDRPATMFVADFIGSPPMNFLNFGGPLAKGDRQIMIGAGRQEVPELRTDMPAADYLLGVRPEHVQIRDDGPVRGEVFGSEYLGTTQVVTIKTPEGQVRARLSSDVPINPGDQLGLAFRPEKLSIFARTTGLAVASALHDGGRR